MLVSDVMQAAVLTITPKTSLLEAIRLVQHRGIRHLPSSKTTGSSALSRIVT